MPALCLMLWYAYYASNYAGIIGTGLLLATTATAGGQNYHTQVSQVDSIQLQVSFAWDIKKLLKKQLLVLLKFIFHIVDVTYAVTMPTSSGTCQDRTSSNPQLLHFTCTYMQ